MHKQISLRSDIVVLGDENILIDTQNNQIRKYNSAGIRIISIIDEGAASIADIMSELQNTSYSELRTKDIEEFISFLRTNNLLV